MYVALLRGINVGGSSRVEMPRLKGCFEDLGFHRVRTYINSGNVLFETRAKDRTRLARRIEKAIEEEFGFSVRVLLRSAGELDRLVKAIPRTWTNDQRMRCDVMFLWREADSGTVLREIPAQRGLEDLRYIPGAEKPRGEDDRDRPLQEPDHSQRQHCPQARRAAQNRPVV